MKKITTGLMALLIFMQLSSQTPVNIDKKDFVAMFYNVENLFDTINDPIKNDEEFTPGSEKKWNSAKYFEKLDRIAEVIAGVSEDQPEIIGMAEVESAVVLSDLIQNERIKKSKYQFVLVEGPDKRGIDVALMYRKKQFKPVSIQTFKNIFPGNEEYPSRDILYVKGKVKKGQVLHVFVNHWSSRSGGMEASEPKRIYAATILRDKVDSLLKVDAESKIIIVGDFNDGPENKSLKEALKAGREISSENGLQNLMFPIVDAKFGSYFYRGNWDVLDNVIVSKNLKADSKGLKLKEDKAFVYHPEFVCYKNKDGILTPNRSFGGNKYYGGYSDHFAVYTVLKF